MFRVYGLGCRVRSSGNLGFGVWVLEFWVGNTADMSLRDRFFEAGLCCENQRR